MLGELDGALRRSGQYAGSVSNYALSPSGCERIRAHADVAVVEVAGPSLG